MDWNRMSSLFRLVGLCFCAFSLFLEAGCSKNRAGQKEEIGQRWACNEKADDAMRQNDFQTGILLHQEFLEREPENPLALYHLGYAFGQSGNHQEEITYYEKAVSLGFRQENILFNMGMAYCELNEPEKGIRAFRQAIETNPESADNHFGLGMAYQMIVSDNLAEEEFLKAIEMDPQHLDARLMLSVLYTDWGELKRAAEQLHKVLEIDPTNRRAKAFLERIERE